MEKIKKYEVLISERAEENIDEIIKYLLIKWNEKVKNKFLGNFIRVVKILEINSLLFQEYSTKKKIRKCLITKRNALYYHIKKDKVEIITIHHTRPQRPKN